MMQYSTLLISCNCVVPKGSICFLNCSLIMPALRSCKKAEGKEHPQAWRIQKGFFGKDLTNIWEKLEGILGLLDGHKRNDFKNNRSRNVCLAALFLLTVNFLTVNTDVGEGLFGFLTHRCGEFVCFPSQASHLLNYSLWAGRGTRWPNSRAAVM